MSDQSTPTPIPPAIAENLEKLKERQTAISANFNLLGELSNQISAAINKIKSKIELLKAEIAEGGRGSELANKQLVEIKDQLDVLLPSFDDANINANKLDDLTRSISDLTTYAENLDNQEPASTGGKKSRKSRKGRKSRKSRKGKKGKKGRKSKKGGWRVKSNKSFSRRRQLRKHK